MKFPKFPLSLAVLVTVTGAAFLLLSGIAVANRLPTASVRCTAVSASWSLFPPNDTVIDIVVTQPGSPTAHVVFHTHGAQQGSTGNLPIAMSGNGEILATVTSAVVDDPPREARYRDDCRPPEEPTTTTTTTGPVSCLATTCPPLRPVELVPPVTVVRVQPGFTG